MTCTISGIINRDFVVSAGNAGGLKARGIEVRRVTARLALSYLAASPWSQVVVTDRTDAGTVRMIAEWSRTGASLVFDVFRL